MKKTILLLFCFCSINSSLGLAQTNLQTFPQLPQQIDQRSPFRQLIEKAESICPTLQCSNSMVQIHELSASERLEIPTSTINAFQKTIFDLAEDEWPDTILEGPYEASFHLSIDQIAKITQGTVTLGYKVLFHDQAWMTDTCDYDPKKPATLAQCQAGRLVESAFFSVDLRESFRDPAQFVEFVADPQH